MLAATVGDLDLLVFAPAELVNEVFRYGERIGIVPCPL